MDVLRFITAGSVDDGKSTLIGRLLYDTDNIKSDILASVSDDAEVNLAHITDGLRAERLQGITIDVAYKYFSTKKRKYIISDAPGHFQYTKNLVTGASGVDVVIILIDALNGITEQTNRHSLVASFLGIRHIVVAINKMDAVDYNEQLFSSIKNEFLTLSEKLHLSEITFIPVSALHGDNISFLSEKMPWYKDTTLIDFLEYCTVHDKEQVYAARFSIQYIIDNGQDIGYAGKVLFGSIKKGDTVIINPQGEKSVAQKIVYGYNEVIEAYAGQNICVYLKDNAIAERGNIISHTDNLPICNNEFEVIICWLDSLTAMQIGKEYLLKINSTETPCKITEILYCIDNTTFDKDTDSKIIEVNQFAKVKIECNAMIAYDSFATIAESGRGILIDSETNNTSGAFTIE